MGTTPPSPPTPPDLAGIVPADRGPDPAGRFPAAERAIFAYDLAGVDLRGDPLAIERRLAAATAGWNPEAVSQWLRAREASRRLLGLRRLVPALRAAFGLPGFDPATGRGFAAAEVLALHGRFCAFRDAAAARWRDEAEFVATFGPDPADAAARSYDRRCGLWWNRGRAQAIAAVATWRGLTAAGGAAPVHFDLADAMAASRAEAEELAAALEAERSAAESRSRNARRA